MASGARTLALQVSEELFARIKEHLKFTGQSQKGFAIGLIEQALAQKADQAKSVGGEQPDGAGTGSE